MFGHLKLHHKWCLNFYFQITQMFNIKNLIKKLFNVNNIHQLNDFFFEEIN